MSEELVQVISLWGGIASILALFGSLAGAFWVIIKKARLRNEEEEKKIELLRSNFSSRAKSATTQGKRMDLFIYHQTLFSSLHTSQITDGIQRLGFMIYS
ncbi:hypothetical protein L1D44_21720, partial [Shewanella sp. Isolate13]|uniref:hypothetical protein n=1 Tax=Shewanella sp. Isolate13 TaxID=2908531 RepID=UPI001EFD122F